jgi:hypothetical protein
MSRFLLANIIVLMAVSHPAEAENGNPYNGKYVVKESRHTTKTKKADGLKQKQTSPKAFNPKELTIDKPTSWKSTP